MPGAVQQARVRANISGRATATAAKTPASSNSLPWYFWYAAFGRSLRGQSVAVSTEPLLEPVRLSPEMELLVEARNLLTALPGWAGVFYLYYGLRWRMRECIYAGAASLALSLLWQFRA